MSRKKTATSYSRVKRKAERANRRLQTTIKYYGGKGGVLDRVAHMLRMTYGYNAKKFSVTKRMSERKLQKIETALDKFLSAKSTSQKGRKEIREKVITELQSKYSVSRSEALKIQQFWDDEASQKLKELAFYNGSPVDYLIADVLRDNSVKAVQKAVREYIDRENERGTPFGVYINDYFKE